MKTKMRSRVYITAAVFIINAALAVPAAAQPDVPFKGVIQGDDTDTGFTQTGVTVLTVGTGTGTHMGRFSFTQTVTVDLTQGTEAGSGEWIAANGDSIFVAIAGSGEEVTTPDGIVIKITETYTITGGTGRFADATGSFTMKRVASPVTFTTSGSFEGTISSPGAAH